MRATRPATSRPGPLLTTARRLGTSWQRATELARWLARCRRRLITPAADLFVLPASRPLAPLSPSLTGTTLYVLAIVLDRPRPVPWHRPTNLTNLTNPAAAPRRPAGPSLHLVGKALRHPRGGRSGRAVAPPTVEALLTVPARTAGLSRSGGWIVPIHGGQARGAAAAARQRPLVPVLSPLLADRRELPVASARAQPAQERGTDFLGTDGRRALHSFEAAADPAADPAAARRGAWAVPTESMVMWSRAPSIRLMPADSPAMLGGLAEARRSPPFTGRPQSAPEAGAARLLRRAGLARSGAAPWRAFATAVTLIIPNRPAGRASAPGAADRSPPSERLHPAAVGHDDPRRPPPPPAAVPAPAAVARKTEDGATIRGATIRTAAPERQAAGPQDAARPSANAAPPATGGIRQGIRPAALSAAPAAPVSLTPAVRTPALVHRALRPAAAPVQDSRPAAAPAAVMAAMAARPPDLDPATLRRALARLPDGDVGRLAEKLFPHFQRQVRRLQERRGGL